MKLPCCIIQPRELSNTQRPMQQSHMNRGFLTLSSLQVRGHAMFSHEGLPLKAETLEYAWLIEVVVGDLVGRLTMAQVHFLFYTVFNSFHITITNILSYSTFFTRLC